jgi:hypothetical protein
MLTTSVALSGLNLVDALVVGDKWGNGVGNGVDLTFSFPYGITNTAQWEQDYSVANEPTLPTGGLSNLEQQAASNALQQWANVADIQFSQVEDIGSQFGVLRITLIDDQSAAGTWGWAYFPSSYGECGGDIWINQQVISSDWAVGSSNFSSLLHEIGHALGLKHPFEDGVTLPAQSDSNQYTLMSYSEHPFANYRSVEQTLHSYSYEIEAIQPSTPMLYDIAAIQYLYGANMNYATGDNVYSFDPETPFFMTLWDAGGVDTISVESFQEGCKIDLRAGQFSSLTILSDELPAWSTVEDDEILYDGTDNLAIAYQVTIENAIGGQGDDLLIGNNVDNVFRAGGGNDTIYGQGGIDTLVRLDTYSSCTVEKQGANLLFTIAGEDEGADHIENVERIVFGDIGLALDLDAAAGTTAKILGATFGAASVANTAFVKIGLDLLDDGMSDVTLAALAINAAGAESNAQIVDLLWTHLVGSHPSAAEAQPFIDQLDNGLNPGALGMMAANLELNTENIGLIGLAESGLLFDLA